MQREKGESIKNQISRLTEYVNGSHNKIKIYEDAGYSAKDTNRPAINRLLIDIKEGKVNSVIVTKLDRITRSIKDLIELLELFEDHGVAFKSITQPLDTSTAMGRGFLRLLGEFAQIEREMTSERVGEDMRHRAKKGRWNGGVIPYGYTVRNMEINKLIKSGLTKEKAEKKVSKKYPEDKMLYINQDEKSDIKKIYDKYIEVESLRAVTEWLNSNGFRTRNNKTWAAASISRILTNPTYIGKIWYNKRISSKTTGRIKNRPREEWIVNDGLHKAIISDKTFNKVQAIIKRQAHKPRRKLSDYLLSGLVRCGKCEGSMYGYTHRKKTPKGERLYGYYVCHNNKSKGGSVCKGNRISQEVLETIVIDKILELTVSKEFKIDIKQALDKFNKKIINEEKPLRGEKEKLERRNTEISKKKTNLLEHLEDNTIDKGTYKNRIGELNLESDNNQKRLYGIESKINDIGIDNVSFNHVYETIKNFKKSWKHLSYLGKKDLLWSMISKVIVKDKEIKIDLFFLPNLNSALCSRTDRGS
jgi:site-specific DNA recombinase